MTAQPARAKAAAVVDLPDPCGPMKATPQLLICTALACRTRSPCKRSTNDMMGPTRYVHASSKVVVHAIQTRSPARSIQNRVPSAYSNRYRWWLRDTTTPAAPVEWRSLWRVRYEPAATGGAAAVW